MINIILIGTGGIGSRHLQALGLIKEPARIQIFDMSDAAMDAAQALFEKNAGAMLKLERVKDMSALMPEADVAIIATGSASRRALCETLLESCKVRYLILEKVLFQRLADYKDMEALFTKKGCKVFVNCPRRMNELYVALADELKGERDITFRIDGSNWGLACNAIHYLDLIAFITGSADGFELDVSGLDGEILQSKRKGYIELTGTVTGKSRGCTGFVLTSLSEQGTPSVVTISTPRRRIVIKEAERSYIDIGGVINPPPVCSTYKGRYQSELTNLVVEQLMRGGTCQLTPYSESVKLHKPFISAVLEHLNKRSGEETDICPIT